MTRHEELPAQKGREKHKRLTAIDLFCGCGGFSLGLIQAGWHVIGALDASIEALTTYYHNLCDENTKIIGNLSRKDWKQIEQSRNDWQLSDLGQKEIGPGWRRSTLMYDPKSHAPAVKALFYAKIEDISGWDILDAAGEDQVDLVVGGPPCQSFSRANTRKKIYDPRNFLIFEFGRVILELKPKTFVMEEVPEVNYLTLKL